MTTRPYTPSPPAISSCWATTASNSTDSREQSPRYGVGFVPVELVIGRVVSVF